VSRSERLVAVFVSVAAVATALAPVARASSGEIARVLSSPDGASAEVAGSVTWSGCTHSVLWPPQPKPGWPGEGIILPPFKEGPWFPPIVEYPPPYCGWVPFATVGPGSDAADCSEEGRRFPGALGEGISLIWGGSERRDLGEEEFDVPDVPLGESDRLVCLTVVEIAPVPVACYMVLGEGVPPCKPFAMARFSLSLDSAQIESSSPEPPAGDHQSPERPPLTPSLEEGLAPAGDPRPDGGHKRCGKRSKQAQSFRVRRCKRHGHRKGDPAAAKA
jgi:hypothetical protein